MIQQVVVTCSNTNKLFIYIYIYWQIRQRNTYTRKKKGKYKRESSKWNFLYLSGFYDIGFFKYILL